MKAPRKQNSFLNPRDIIKGATGASWGVPTDALGSLSAAKGKAKHALIPGENAKPAARDWLSTKKKPHVPAASARLTLSGWGWKISTPPSNGELMSPGSSKTGRAVDRLAERPFQSIVLANYVAVLYSLTTKSCEILSCSASRISPGFLRNTSLNAPSADRRVFRMKGSPMRSYPTPGKRNSSSVTSFMLSPRVNRFTRSDELISALIALLFFGITSFSKADDSIRLIEHLESVPSAEMHVYGLRDDRGMSMDCLKVFQPEDSFQGSFLGVYHHRSGGSFLVSLARSQNLVDWTFVVTLDSHASQATIQQCDNGALLLAYEKDAPDSCWIRLRYYDNLDDLIVGTHAREFDIERTLAPTAEGTPSFESVTMAGKNIDLSEVELRFHYYMNRRVDQLARGILTGFKSWHSKPSDRINREFITRGWRGNLGDRDRFIWQGNVYYLQEIQKRRGDWSSWRIWLCGDEGMPIRPLSVKTHNGSVAFANPNASWIVDPKAQRKLVMTLFLPSEGNSRQESGTLLYVINPKTGRALVNKVAKEGDGS